jgi:hypothetical protein
VSDTLPPTNPNEGHVGAQNILDPQCLEALALDPARLGIHAERVNKALSNEVVTTLPCHGACTTNNGAVISWKRAVRFAEGDWGGRVRAFADSAQKYWNGRYLVTCIPAAGAASRYLATIRKFVAQFESLLQAAHALDAPKSPTPALAEGAPTLGPQGLQAFRAECLQLVLSADLRNLADAVQVSFPDVSHRAQEIFSGLSRHLSHEEPLPPGCLGKSASERWLPGVPTATDDRWVSPWDAPGMSGASGAGRSHGNGEWMIRNNWEPYGLLGGGISRSAPTATLKPHSATLESWRPASDHMAPLRIVNNTDRSTSQLHGLGRGGRARSPLHEREVDALLIFSACRALLDFYESQPKAFVPTTAEGDDFLFLKLVEQMSLIPCRSNILICPAGQKDEFERRIKVAGQRMILESRNIFELARTPFAPNWLSSRVGSSDPLSPDRDQGHSKRESSRGEWQVMEQGNSLSTIRFDDEGRPIKTATGGYSLVSAGHGELVHLFGDILREYPEAECLHIRNIDNVIGSGPERRREIQTPARVFRIVRDCLEALRFYFDDLAAGTTTGPHGNTVSERARGALRTLARLAESWQQPEDAALDPANMCLHAGEVLGSLFHWPELQPSEPMINRARQLSQWLARPLSVFGVVRKETGDVGGGPVFTTTASGESIKLCMEMPHASDSDRESYFGARGKATHFNPVLVFFELQTHKPLEGMTPKSPSQHEVWNKGRPVNFAQLFDDRFWLLARKEFEGRRVCYHETVLYELIGNSARTNLLFVEVPRTLFNPHKTFMDGLGQDRRSYGFGETLKAQDERPDSV